MDHRIRKRPSSAPQLRHYATRLGRTDANPDPVGQDGILPYKLKGLPEPKGQALILIAVAFVVLLGFVGLTTDVGQLFIQMGHLRRATDAASLAAAAQYREGRTIAEMTAAAHQVIELNGVDPDTYSVIVQTCESTPGDAQLCTTPRRKLVRVNSELDVPMSFLALVGVNNIEITSNSIGEAASIDVVLAIDVSESMVWDAGSGNPMRDPTNCNAADPGGADGFPGECQPFEEVKRSAASFVNRILNKPAGQEEDRLAIVTFANGWDSNKNRGTHYRTTGWTSDSADALDIIQHLTVYEPGRCWVDELNLIPQTFYGPCQDYDDDLGVYQGFDCLSCIYDDPSKIALGEFSDPIDLSALPTTNIGGALLRAGNMFALNTREDALWVVVLLTDGMANATDIENDDDITDGSTLPLGYCPNEQALNGSWIFPLCQDENVSTRHGNGNTRYDADDYARDMADFVGCLPINPASACNGLKGQGAVIFTIGLGNGVLDDGCSSGYCEVGPDGNKNTAGDARPYGANLLRYIAAVGYAGDPDPANDPCKGFSDPRAWCGNYYFAPQGPQLARIFEDIASRIFTRITH